MRAALGKIKVIKELVGNHNLFSFCVFSTENKKSAVAYTPEKRSKCGLSVLFNPKRLCLGHHIRRAAFDKIIKVKLLVHHFSCLLCDFLDESIAH